MKNIKNMINNLSKLEKAFIEVNHAWSMCGEMDNLKNSEYPFKESFDELTLKVKNWVEDSIDELEYESKYKDKL